MTQALARYQVLTESLRTRRRRAERLNWLDQLAARAIVKARNWRINLAYLRREAQAIDRASPEARGMSEAVLAHEIEAIREVFVRGRHDAAAIRRGFALVREAARRETGEEAYIVQLIGAMAMYHGRVIEMLTGEGKTLTASIAAPLVAWPRRSLHVFTVNDYLAGRDAESRRAIYTRCGLTVAAVHGQMDQDALSKAYACSIVYGTPKQITADYLRDQIQLGACGPAWSARQSLLGPRGGGGGGGPRILVPGLRAALVDEADAVLIDEGVVPLIIARTRGADGAADAYRQAALMTTSLEQGTDYSVQLLRRRVTLTKPGRDKCHALFADQNDAIWRALRRGEELVCLALTAKHCYIRGRQYQVADDRVAIVDEFTGRFLPDRHWEYGLHQAVEAKEGLEITADRETLARMSFQRFFRLYPFLCGMTGTAADAIAEIESVYQHKVTAIPTNRPIRRVELPMRIFRSAQARWVAVADSVAEVYAQGRPILIGTRSVEASETVAGLLLARGLPHSVLNANFDKDEAMIISRAGEAGGIVVATNMAGRGTDIKLDLKARNAGGLHVILTEMHGAKRIDRQFIGRAGRQGDPGSSQLFASLHDELIRLYAPRLGSGIELLARGGPDELRGAALAAGRRVFRFAQRANELRDRTMRGEVLKQDDWMEKHLPGL